MSEQTPLQIWAMRAGFWLLAITIISLHLIPLDTQPRRWAPPDLLLAFTFAWSMRRPDYLPPWSVGAVFLMADLLLQRPPGLMAALVVLGCDNLRNRFAGLRDASFAGEWLAVGLMIVAVTVLNRIVLSLLAVDLAPLGLILIQMVLTVIAYPAVAGVTQFLMRVRRTDHRETAGAGLKA